MIRMKFDIDLSCDWCVGINRNTTLYHPIVVETGSRTVALGYGNVTIGDLLKGFNEVLDNKEEEKTKKMEKEPNDPMVFHGIPIRGGDLNDKKKRIQSYKERKETIRRIMKKNKERKRRYKDLITRLYYLLDVK